MPDAPYSGNSGHSLDRFPGRSPEPGLPSAAYGDASRLRPEFAAEMRRLREALQALGGTDRTG